MSQRLDDLEARVGQLERDDVFAGAAPTSNGDDLRREVERLTSLLAAAEAEQRRLEVALEKEAYSAEIMFQFRSFVGLHFYFRTVASCVLEVVIILVETKKFYLIFLHLLLFLLFFSDFLNFFLFQFYLLNYLLFIYLMNEFSQQQPH